MKCYHVSAELWVVYSDELVSKSEIVAEFFQQIDAETGATLRDIAGRMSQIAFPKARQFIC